MISQTAPVSKPKRPPPVTTKAEIVLTTEELVKIYGGRAVVNGVNMHVRANEIVGLLGPNGAGKTTSFYMIVGLVRPNGGRVIFSDTDVTDFPMYKRARLGMGYLPQEESIFRKMTVEQNILAILETLPLSKAERRNRKSGLAIMITDHNVRETLSIVDRAYLIYDGRVESEGTKDFLIDDPISRQLYLGERFKM